MDIVTDEPINTTPQDIILLDGDIRRQIKLELNFSNTNKYVRPQVYVIYNALRKKAVQNAHLEFLRAGSSYIRTNTHCALLPFMNKWYSLNLNDLSNLIKHAILNAQAAIDRYSRESNISKNKFRVVGSCGCPLDMDNLSPHKWIDAHRQRIKIFADNNINLISLEGVNSVEEAEILLVLLEEFPSVRALMIFNESCFDYLKIKQIFEYCYNLPIWQVVAIGLDRSTKYQAIILSTINKTRHPEDFIPLVVFYSSKWEEMPAHTSTPALEWAQMGIRYMSGDWNVTAEGILSLYRKLNGSHNGTS